MSRRIVLATSRESPDLTSSDRLYAEALARRGCDVATAAWDDDPAAFARADAVILRATWGYYRALEAFRAWTENVAAATILLNSIDLVRWNLRKDYLGKLEAAGVAVPRSHVVACEVAAIAGAMAQEGWVSHGEISLVYFDGVFSHATRKRPPPGEFRSNSRYGPTRSSEIPPPAVVQQGVACLARLP